MGYAYYEIGGMKRGYGVRCKCHKRGCKERIDRGLAYLCHSCQRYFCGQHLTVAEGADGKLLEFESFAGRHPECCHKCAREAETEDREEHAAHA